ncbi:MAG: PEP-CTERM sorting domain-containing protein [Sedimentisphaerales bacterium]|nr:PEP-CTERM sorting domain-containing protein [Sedimentisphaerales bacterium]
MKKLAVLLMAVALSAAACALTTQTYGDFDDNQAGGAGYVFTPDLPQYTETGDPMPQTAYLTSWTYAKSSSGYGGAAQTYLAVYSYDSASGFQTLLGTSSNYIDFPAAAPLALLTWDFGGIELDKDTQYALMFVDQTGAIASGGVELDTSDSTMNGFIQTGYTTVNKPTWEAHFSATYSNTIPEPTTMILLAVGGLLLRRRRV